MTALHVVNASFNDYISAHATRPGIAALERKQFSSNFL